MDFRDRSVNQFSVQVQGFSGLRSVVVPIEKDWM